MTSTLPMAIEAPALSQFSDLRGRLGALGPRKLLAAAAVLLTIVGLGGALLSRVGNAPQSLLYGELSPADAAAVVARLDAQGVPYALSADGRGVMVAADQAARLRLDLAAEGVPAQASLGNELLDAANPLTTSDFLANVNLRRALEGELARTIAAFAAVQEARVHLVLPQRELFERERQAPSASVLLRLRAARMLEPRQVEAIRQLVATAVPGLPPNRVTIVDDRGVLLAKSTDGQGDGPPPQEIDAARIAYEDRLRGKILNLLERSLGPGKALVEVTADLDFDAETVTSETFDPNGQVARSLRTTEEANDRAEAATPPVSVTNNLPTERTPAEGNGPGEKGRRSEETQNFEISKTVRSHVRNGPTVRRLTVAVQVDSVASIGADGVPVSQPRPQAELDQLAALVRSAGGLSEERGDTVEIVSQALAPLAANDGTAAAKPWPVNPQRVAELAAALLGLVLVLLFGVRPLLRTVQPVPADGAITTLDPANALGAITTAAGSAEDGSVTGGDLPPSFAPAVVLPNGESAELLQLAGPDRKALLDEIALLIDRNPQEVLRVVRSWIASE